MTLFEPKRNNSLSSLDADFRLKVIELLHNMQTHDYDPVVFEALRSKARQQWLYSIGRTRQKNRKPVTWTLSSRHLSGKAADIISKSKGWNSPAFFSALKQEAEKLGLRVIPQEQCHVEAVS